MPRTRGGNAMRVGGIVLCGGRSTRMGRSKAWLPIDGEPMLVRVVRRVGAAVRPVVVVAADGQELPPLPPDVLVIRDPEPDRGPLVGLVAGLAALDADAAFTAACDLPFLTAAFAHRVLEHLDGFDACVPQVGGRPHPLAAAYTLAVRPVAEAHLRAGRLRLTDLLAAIRTRDLGESAFAGVGTEAVRNVNTPGEYAAVSRPGPPAPP